MGSRWKNLFGGHSSTNKSLKGGTGSYDSAVALEPPVKGSYPVAGNGPNVLDEIQRSRARKEARYQSPTANNRQSYMSSSFAPSNTRTAKQHHEDSIERPRTAPSNGVSPGDFASPANAVDTHARTRSGFSMKSPPKFFSSKRQSTYLTQSFVPVASPPPLPKDDTRVVQAYIPSKGPSYTPSPTSNPTPSRSPVPQELQTQYSNGFVPPFAQHQRNMSQGSHKSHVDLLDAYSSIRSGKETSESRTKASGVRNYGEDVADRNIAGFGEKSPTKLDLNSPEFGYMKSVYTVNGRAGGGADAHSRAGSASGYVLGNDAGLGDDPISGTNGGQATSIRSFNTTGPRPGMSYPARIDSASTAGYGASGGRDRPNSSIPGGTHNPRGRALSPLSDARYDDPPPKDPRRQTTDYSRSGSVPSRGRTLASNATQPFPSFSQRPPSSGQEPLRMASPITTPPRVTSPIHSRNSSTAGQGKQRQRTTSTTSQTNGSTKSRSGSVTYSPFPTISRRESLVQDYSNDTVPRSMANSGNRRTASTSDMTKESTGLYGMSDMALSIDTDVVTNRNPAVLQEHVSPTRHDIRSEHIPHQIQKLDAFHRVRAIIDTEAVPPKHYVYASDGKALVEIPESQRSDNLYHSAANRRLESEERRFGTPVQHRRDSSNANSLHPQQDTIFEEVGADPPVIPLARRDPNYDPKYGRSRGDSRSSVKSTVSKPGSRTRNIIEPFLNSKKERTTTRDGIPHSDYVWHHPPTMENSGRANSLRTAPARPDLNQISGFDYSDDEDIEGKEFGAMREDFDIAVQRRQRSSSADLEYRGVGMLPGLEAPAPSSRTLRRDFRHLDGVDGRNRFGEATVAMRRLAERQRNAAGAGFGVGEMNVV